MSGARTVIGSDRPREALAKFFYSRRVHTAKPHVIEQAAEICGVPLPPREVAAAALPVDAAAERWCEEFLRDGERFALLNPGAGWGAKQWPAERYGEVARELQKAGVRSIIHAIPSEIELAEQAETASEGAATRVECSLVQLIALTRRAALFVGGDTGPMHLANLQGIPVVAIFGPTDPARNGPYYTPHVVVRNAASVTSYSHTNAEDAGIVNITSAEVITAARSLLHL